MNKIVDCRHYQCNSNNYLSKLSLDNLAFLIKQQLPNNKLSLILDDDKNLDDYQFNDKQNIDIVSEDYLCNFNEDDIFTLYTFNISESDNLLKEVAEFTNVKIRQLNIPEEYSLVQIESHQRQIIKNATKYKMPLLIHGEIGTNKESMIDYYRRLLKVDNIYKVSCFNNNLDFDKILGNDGVIVIDNVTKLNLNSQYELLQELNCTKNKAIILTSTEPIIDMVAKGEFIEELYCEIATCTVQLKNIRDYKKIDFVNFINAYIIKLNQEYGENKSLKKNCHNLLKFYNFPGNESELKYLLKTAFTMTDNEQIGKVDLQLPRTYSSLCRVGIEDRINEGIDLVEESSLYQKEYIETALHITNHNKTAAAKLLGFETYQHMNSRLESVENQLEKIKKKKIEK